jgi:hypothetical protein
VAIRLLRAGVRTHSGRVAAGVVLIFPRGFGSDSTYCVSRLSSSQIPILGGTGTHRADVVQPEPLYVKEVVVEPRRIHSDFGGWIEGLLLSGCSSKAFAKMRKTDREGGRAVGGREGSREVRKGNRHAIETIDNFIEEQRKNGVI